VTGALVAAVIALTGAAHDAAAKSRVLALGGGTPLCTSARTSGLPAGGHASVTVRGDCPVKSTTRPFASWSFWNAPLDSEVPLDPRSSTYVARLRDSIAAHGSWINTTQWSTPVYTVAAGVPTVAVALDQSPGVNLDLRRAFASVPIPAGAQPSPDSDAHLVVWQPSTDSMWELWGARQAADGWHMRFGGKMDDVSSNPGYFPSNPGWGGTATGLPMLGGLIRIAELRAGRIDHALALGIPEPARNRFVWPAQRGDGDSTAGNAIPEGTRMRIDPDLDLAKLKLPPLTRMLAEAAQRYGIVVVDRSGTVSVAGEDPSGPNPYWPSPSGFFGGKMPDQLLASFPWARLQVVR
jgi:hypothetical protein